MTKQMTDKRENSRVFFTLEEDVTATLVSHEGKKIEIEVTLLSLSCGGLSFIGNRFKLPKMKEGDKLYFININTSLPLGTIDSLETSIAYILDFEHNVRLSVGCEFAHCPDDLKQKIDDFVHFRFKNLGVTP